MICPSSVLIYDKESFHLIHLLYDPAIEPLIMKRRNEKVEEYLKSPLMYENGTRGENGISLGCFHVHNLVIQMSIIVFLDNEYHVLDNSVLLKGSVEAVGETVNINFYGVHRAALYCEGGIPKKLNREISKWKDGTKTFQNQQKVESKVGD